MSSDKNPLISRIRKMLALANDAGATEHEAATALEMVQDLLQQHGLDMAAVSSSTPDEETEEATRQRFAGGPPISNVWRNQIMETLAENGFCLYFVEDYDRPVGVGIVSKWSAERGDYIKMRRTITERVKRYVLIGRAVNVATVRVTYDYLTGAIARIARENGIIYPSKEHLPWHRGCADRLCERLRDRRKVMEQASSTERERKPESNGTSRELVTLKDLYGSEADLNEDMRRGQPSGTAARKRRENEAQQAAEREARTARAAALVAEGVPPEVARWMSYGYSREDAEAAVKRYAAKPETEAQRRKRERRDQAWWDRYNQRQWREGAYRRTAAYQEGLGAGDAIGLDDQVDQERRAVIGRG